MSVVGPTFVDRLFPYRGTWSFPWIVGRYLHGAIPGFNPRRLGNAALAFAEMRMARPRVRSRPSVLRIEPSNVCTLRCPNCACGVGSDPRRKGFMQLEHLRLLLEQAGRYAIVARLDGMGEPTMNPAICDMIDLIKSYGISVTMSSNFNMAICDRSDDFIDAGLDRLMVCVDGATQDVYERYRVRGDLGEVERRVRALVEAKRRRDARRPIVEMQFLDLDCNRHQLDEMKTLARDWGVDKLTVTRADPTSKVARAKVPRNPKRCFWLWYVLTVGWDLGYRSCTNAWSLPWPDLNLRDLPVDAYWNHRYLQEARRFNKNRSSDLIANDQGCKCNRCFEMLVVPMEGDYFCE